MGATVETRAERLQLAARSRHRNLVLQISGVTNGDIRKELASIGIRLGRSLGGDAYFAELDWGVLTPELLVSAKAVADVRELPASAKIHPVLTEPAGLSRLPTATPAVHVYARFHDGRSMATAVESAQALGGVVVGRVGLTNTLILAIPFARIRELAALDSVAWVEPALPGWSHTNDGVRVRTGADVAGSQPYGLDGDGVRVLIYDSGLVDAGHVDLVGRVLAADEAPVELHATHIAGTLGGSGAGSGGLYRGVAPAVEMVSAAFRPVGEGITLFADIGDLELDYRAAASHFGVSIASNSMGPNLCFNGFPCIYAGDYGVASSLLDALVRGEGGRPLIVVWSAGNERSCLRCGMVVDGERAGYASVAPPACAKNPIVVGAVNSNDESMTEFSSWGPCDDGRIKPDVVAPGCQSDGDHGITSCADGGGYASMCGTSMSAPVVSGAAALLVQEYRRSSGRAVDPLNSTVKAALVHSAEDLGLPGPDYQSGYGAIRIPRAADLIRGGACIEGEVGQGESQFLLIPVTTVTDEIRATLAWDDVAGVENVVDALVNDLDLVLHGPGGDAEFPWVLDPGLPTRAAVRVYPDRTNNVEQAVVAGPAAGIWRAEVRGSRVPDGPQRFSICTTPERRKCAEPASAWASRSRHGCEDAIGLWLSDCAADRQPQVRETVVVQVRSGSGESRSGLLVETSESSGVFAGDVSLSSGSIKGSLRVAHGDEVFLDYVPSGSGGGTHTFVVSRIDCVPPNIEAVSVVAVATDSAEVALQTNEASEVQVAYGAVCGAFEGARGGFSPDPGQVVLRGLQADTTYYFNVSAMDAAGNSAVNDLDGRCYSFRTSEAEPSLTEQFESNLDLAHTEVRFVPEGDGYATCAEGSGFLTVVEGEVPLGLGDDEPVRVAFSSGRMLTFFGVSYSEMFVSPNGYVTFGEEDTTYLETLESHYRVPRISALFRDLDASRSGRVAYGELDDRVVLTWWSVPEHDSEKRNTFQVEMEFSGAITIRFAELESQDGITGLSRGNGVLAGFREADLSAAVDCRPHPPRAKTGRVAATESAPARVFLEADDDGQPQPPGRVRRVITSLPERGVLISVSGALIRSAPYSLPWEVQSVIYVPRQGFVGEDQFRFVADDGGVSPSGGLSRAATMTIAVAEDCNGNRRSDGEDLASHEGTDCNINGLLDACDLSSMQSADCNGNGVPDECDAVGIGSVSDTVVFDPPLTIPDGGFVVARIEAEREGVVRQLRVQLHLDHPAMEEVTVLLEHQNRVVVLVDACAGEKGLQGAVLEDSAGRTICEGAGEYRGVFRPVQPLAAFRGLPIAGEWRLFVRDGSVGGSGVLRHAAILFTPDIDCDDDFSPDACGCGPLLGDVDDDGDIDLADWAVFQTCAGHSACGGCACGDVTADQEIDVGDASTVARRMTGP